MEFKDIKTEEDAIEWIGLNTPVLIKPSRPSKTTYISPFSSQRGLNTVVTELGKKLFKELAN